MRLKMTDEEAVSYLDIILVGWDSHLGCEQAVHSWGS